MNQRHLRGDSESYLGADYYDHFDHTVGKPLYTRAPSPMQTTVTSTSPIQRTTLCLNPPVAQPRTATVQTPWGGLLTAQLEGIGKNESGLYTTAEAIWLDASPKPGAHLFMNVSGKASGLRCKPAPDARTWIETAPSFQLDGQRVDCLWDTDAQGEAVYFRTGPVCITRKFWSRHFFGWVTVYDSLDVVEMQVRFHNAALGAAPLFFDTLTLIGDPGREIFYCAAPWFEPTASNPHLWLVTKRSDGKKHALPQRAGRTWRFVFTGNVAQQGLCAMLAARHDWSRSDTWSTVGGYGAQAQRIPNMPAAKQTEANNIASGRHAVAQNAILKGCRFGIGTTEGTGLGLVDWMQMWGAEYGGITGGGWRYQFDRVAMCALIGGNREAVVELEARHACISHRMPTMIVEDKGHVALLEHYCDANGHPNGGWRMSSADGRFDGQGKLDAPFGYHAAAQGVDTSVAAQWLELTAYAPIDFQHHDRAYSSMVALAYLCNDPMAIWDLRMLAEVWRMSMVPSGRLTAEMLQVGTGGKGTSWGRAHGLCWALSCHAYALSGEDWRARWLPTLMLAANMLELAQMSHGLFRASTATAKDNAQAPGCFDTVNNRPLYKVTKFTEEAQLENFLACFFGAVSWSVALEAAIARWGLALQNYVGCHFPDWCAVSDPQGHVYTTCPWTSGADRTEVGAGIGFAVEGANDLGAPDLSALLTAYIGGAGTFAALAAKKLDGEPTCIDDTTSLLAAIEPMP